MTPIWLQHEKLKTFFTLCSDAGYKLYFVGGCVRDYLDGYHNAKDIDMAVDCPIEKICTLCGYHNIPYKIIGIKYGTITILGFPPYHVEITALRNEDYYDGRYPKYVTFDNITLYQDAKRRDFTCNALYFHPDEGIIDFFNGQDDLKNKNLRFIGEAHDKIQEDYLRILRYFRFWAKFNNNINNISDDILSLITKYAPQYLPQLTSERIGKEVFKICGEKNFSPTINLMDKCGIWSIFGIILTREIQNALTYMTHYHLINADMVFAILCSHHNKKDIIDLCRKWAISYKKNIFFQSRYQSIINYAQQNNEIHISRLKQHDDDNENLAYIIHYITALKYITYEQSQYLQRELKSYHYKKMPISTEMIIRRYNLYQKHIALYVNQAKEFWLNSHTKASQEDIYQHLDNYNPADE